MDFNTAQFPQPGRGQRAFRGFGDQAMQRHRVTPAPTPAPAPSAPPRAQGQQTSLFQADEVRNPQGPPAPTFNASQFRISRPALPGMSTRSMASQRVTPTPAPQTPDPAPGRSSYVQPELTMLGPTPSSPHAPGAAGPSPTHWPTPAADQPGPSSGPARTRTVTINRAQYVNAGPSRPALTPEAPAPAASRPAPVPERPSTPPAVGPARPTGPTALGRAAGAAGVAVGLGAKAFQSVNRVATDPARSGNPLFKTSGGWNKA
ncbi:hypothetical protein [Streptomyces sp. NPDC088360]|uniref:hypothetical protein n=1 Tax=Streptomyces sp. NPDC088360 TaxID=3154515 RepID=UPI00344B819D